MPKESRVFIERIAALILITIITGCLSLVEAQKLYAPVLGSEGSELRLALVNPTLASETVTLTARGYDGSILRGSGITNPVTLSLNPSSQRSLQAIDAFGYGISGLTGWVELSASTRAVTGLSGFGPTDWHELRRVPSSQLVFPKVSASSATQLSLVNTGSETIKAVISIYENSGHFAGAWGIVLPALAGLNGSLREIAPQSADFIAGFEGYAVVQTVSQDQSGLESLIGMETDHGTVAVTVSALPGSSRLADGYLTYFAAQGGYSARLSMVNVDDGAQELQVTAVSGRANGAAPVRSAVKITLPSHAKLEADLAQLFNLQDSGLINGYLHFEATTNTPGVFAYLDYGRTGDTASAVEPQGQAYSNLYLPHIADGNGLNTGLFLANPNGEPSVVTLDIFDNAGNRGASTVVNLQPDERKAGVLNEFFHSAVNLVDGYVRLTATRPVLAQIGSTAAAALIGSVAIDGARLEPQLNSRTLSASEGGQVVSPDGTTSLLVPPDAIDSDIPISVTPVDARDFPQPTSDQRAVTAVTGLPSGTHFRIPARLDFPLNVELSPGASVPLLIFHPETGAYEQTDFFAIVDDSGRMASAEVTHFTTFVAAVPNSQLLTVSSISPSSGLPGTAVTITGSGFSATPSNNIVTFAGTYNTSVAAVVTAATTTSLAVIVPNAAVTGSVIVSVGSQTSSGVLFTVPSGNNPLPTNVAVSPTGASAKLQSLQLQVSGIGFMAASVVLYDGSAYPSTYVDSTLMTINLTNSYLKTGVHKVQVVNPAPGGGASNTADFTVRGSGPVNQAPFVSAGSNQTVILPAMANLSGQASDDGLPSGSTLTTTWSQYSGPGVVTFGDPKALSTTASFSKAGSYVLRLTASDGALSSISDVTITANSGANQAPTVSAGANQTITLPASAALSGTASDDGLPSGTLTTTWSKVSGPGTVTFGNANSSATNASFSASGSYVLRLTANDGALSASSDVTITASAGCGTAVSGTRTLSATATSAVGMAGVQFKLDGVNLGAEDLTAPYSMTWNTTTTSNGCHTVTAVARDTLGNLGVSQALSVNVSN